jgi:hypothetical protein
VDSRLVAPGNAARSAGLGAGRRAGVGDGAVGVLEAQKGVDGDRGGDAGAGGRRDERPRVRAVAGCVDAVDGVLVFQKGVGTDLLGFTQVERIDA